MKDSKSARLTVGGLLAAALIMVAGGVAVASNMGFKMNKVLYRRLPATVPGSSQIGNNRISIPYNNPYDSNGDGVSDVKGFCDQTGLTARVGDVTVRSLAGSNGAFSTVTCDTATAANILPTAQGLGVEVGVAFNVADGAFAGQVGPPAKGDSFSVIIVGSHNPTTVVNSCAPGALSPNQGNVWFGVPYHTTAVNLNDICVQHSASASSIITRLNAETGVFDAPACGPTAALVNLQLGDLVQLRDTSAPLGCTPAVPCCIKGIIPAHF